MPSVRTSLFHVMPNFRRTDSNAATTTDDLQWQPVIGIVAGFLAILLAVYLLHMLFQFHASGVPHRILGLPSGTRRVSHSVTESETSGSWPGLMRPAGPPPPYTARLDAIPLYTVTVPPRSFQGGVRYPPNYLSPPRRHVDEPISRG